MSETNNPDDGRATRRQMMNRKSNFTQFGYQPGRGGLIKDTNQKEKQRWMWDPMFLELETNSGLTVRLSCPLPDGFS